MRATLAKNLRKAHNVRTMPVKKNDEVIVVKGFIYYFFNNYYEFYF